MQETEKKPSEQMDVLIYMSDQHGGLCNGFMGDNIAKTPNLDAIARDGAVFENAYTSCPLCVPARASFLTSQLPSNLGVFDNNSDFKSSDITVCHMFDVAGYDTNLIGRMHFNGMDYFHGFKNRIGKDISNSYWGYNAIDREEWGDFGRTLAQVTCLEVIGSGNSPVLEYDKEVVANAIEFYKQDHKAPQFTVVGTYSPHFPYMCEKDRVEKFEKIVQKNFEREKFMHELSPCACKIQNATDDDIIKVRAIYYAMIEIMDEQIKLVYDEYQNYLKRNGRKGIFVYLSDHGDQIGYNDMYGKQTFFEMSAKIPVVFSGDGIKSARITESVSIMDIAPTLCELCGVQNIPFAEGQSFVNLMDGENQAGRYAISELYDIKSDSVTLGYMVHRDGQKLITYNGFEDVDLLFDINQDKKEKENIAKKETTVYNVLKNILVNDGRINNHSKKAMRDRECQAVLKSVGKGRADLNPYCYKVPPYCNKVSEEFKRPRRT